MTLRERLVEEAMEWQGTAWHHRACVKGVGVDCARFFEGIAKAVGLLPASWEPPIYSPEFHLHNNEEMLLSVLVELGCLPIPIEARQPGDLLAMQYGRVSSHVALLVAIRPDYIIHAANDIGCVSHQRLDALHLARVRGVYVFPGLEEAA